MPRPAHRPHSGRRKATEAWVSSQLPCSATATGASSNPNQPPRRTLLHDRSHQSRYLDSANHYLTQAADPNIASHRPHRPSPTSEFSDTPQPPNHGVRPGARARSRVVQAEVDRVAGMGDEAQEPAVGDQGLDKGVRPDRRQHQGVTKRWPDHRRGAEAIGR